MRPVPAMTYLLGVVWAAILTETETLANPWRRPPTYRTLRRSPRSVA
jgi:hypothetical protein